MGETRISGKSGEVVIGGSEAPVVVAAMGFVMQTGNVLAGLYAKRSTIPDKLFLDVVEFERGKGRVLACGLPTMIFEMNFSWRGNAYAYFKDMQRFISNMAAYLGDRDRPAFAPRPLKGPFFHKDVAKIEINPDLKWKVSGGSNGGAPYTLDLRNYWRGGKEPAWTECHFGKPLNISTVSVVSYYKGYTYEVTHFRVKVRDEKTGEFVDVEPEAVYDGKLCDAGVGDKAQPYGRFSFKPVKTSAVRIEELRGRPAFVYKTNPFPALPVGIYNIVVLAEGDGGFIQ